MPTPAWQAGTLYAPGSLVRPLSNPPQSQSAPDNPGFEDGDMGWTKGTGWTIMSNSGPEQALEGNWFAKFSGTASAFLVNNNEVDVTPGMTINAQCFINTGSNANENNAARIQIRWLDEDDLEIQVDQGSRISRSNNTWRASVVTATAPAGAATAVFVVLAFRDSGTFTCYVDNCSWDYTASAAPTGLIFRAVQAATGFSGNAEPVWPATLGLTVVDNEVTWEAVATSRVVWEAFPIFKSGTYEPAWPEEIGGSVVDGNMIWTAVSRQILDERCPHSPQVVIAAKKIFGADGDIAPYSATANPLDWSSADDAGYIPFGLNLYGSNDIAVLGLYRGNLMIFNSEAYQMWQVDEDPTNIAILDAQPVGSVYHAAFAPIANDSILLTKQGIRSVSIAGGSTNLQAGRFGEAVDPLVRPKIVAAEHTPFTIVWPDAGQAWVIFGDEAFVLTMNGTGTKSQTWSRYAFPEVITDAVVKDGELYLRTEANTVWKVRDDLTLDDVHHVTSTFISIIAAVGTINGQPAIGANAYTGGVDLGYGTISDLALPIFTSSTTFGVINGTTLYAAFSIGGGAVLPPVDYFYGFQLTDRNGTQREFLSSTANTSTSGNRRIWTWTVADDLFDAAEFYEVLFFEQDDAGEEFEGIIQWPHLDFGSLAREKIFESIDVIATAPEGVSVSIGYDQRDVDVRTDPYELSEADTAPGTPVPIGVAGPSFDVQLIFAPNQIWTWDALMVYTL